LDPLDVRPRPDTAHALLDWLRSELADYAEREGFALVEVFVERTGNNAALSALMDALRLHEAKAVVVPALDHLSQFPGRRLALRLLIERETGARVHVVYP
jgi:hypothetical protein